MKQSPCQIADGGAVPKPAEAHHDHQVEICARAPEAIAAERNVEIGPQPVRQRDVPARPEFGKRTGNIRKIEIDRQTIAEQQSETDRDRGVAEKIGVDLIAVEDDQQPAIRGLQRLVQRKVQIGRHRVEVIGDIELEEEPDDDPLHRLHDRHVH